MKKRIVLTTFGSLGDLHPYIAVALGLRARGHDAVIATSGCYCQKVEAVGIGFRYSPSKLTNARCLPSGLHRTRPHGVLRCVICRCCPPSTSIVQTFGTPSLIADFLRRQGVPQVNAWITALSGKGWWRLADSPSANHAMPIQWFDSLGLVRLVHRYVKLQT